MIEPMIHAVSPSYVEMQVGLSKIPLYELTGN